MVSIIMLDLPSSLTHKVNLIVIIFDKVNNGHRNIT